MYKNFSLGAHTATVDRPPTMPAVYSAARSKIGPPTNDIGARMAPYSFRNGFSYFKIGYYYQSNRVTTAYHDGTMCGPSQLFRSDAFFVWNGPSDHSSSNNQRHCCNERHPASSAHQIEYGGRAENGSCTGSRYGHRAAEVGISAVYTLAYVFWPQPVRKIEFKLQ